MFILTTSVVRLPWLSLIFLSITGCVRGNLQEIGLSPSVHPLPQDPQIQVYFNNSLSASYQEPYRRLTRTGDNLEQVILEGIGSSSQSVDVAVQEFRLPLIAEALVKRHQAGVKIRVIVENTYRRPWGNYSPDDLAKLSSREKERYQEFVRLADLNGDGQLSQEEIDQRDALVMLEKAKIPIIDDSQDRSQGSDLMHHKFLVIDRKWVIVSSANFTTSDVHGDFVNPDSRGNPNHVLKIESVPLAELFTEEFNQMWGGDGRENQERKFGLQKRWRSSQEIRVGSTQILVKFSPTSPQVPWLESSNGLIGQILPKATQSINFALFVFSEQIIGNILEKQSERGIKIKGLIDRSFIYRPYSEALDLMGVFLPNEKCVVSSDNHPWKTPLETVGFPLLPQGDLLHHKFAVLDQKIVITGSHNWTKAANLSNDETLLVIDNPTVAAHFQREFDRLYRNSVLGLPSKVVNKIEKQIQKCSTQPSPSPVSKQKRTPGLININKASQAELETLPGVGEKLAKRLIEARQQKPFSSFEEIDQRVSGVSQKMTEKWRDRLTF